MKVIDTVDHSLLLFQNVGSDSWLAHVKKFLQPLIDTGLCNIVKSYFGQTADYTAMFICKQGETYIKINLNNLCKYQCQTPQLLYDFLSDYVITERKNTMLNYVRDCIDILS